MKYCWLLITLLFLLEAIGIWRDKGFWNETTTDKLYLFIISGLLTLEYFK